MISSTQTHSRLPAKASFKTYSKALIALHWLMFLLLIAVYASIELRVFFEKGTAERDFMKSLHFMLGISVLLMVVLRLVSRKFSATPEKTTAKGWHALPDVLAKLGHLALYALMLGLPVMGWLMLSAAGKPIPFFGFELPALIAPDKALASNIKELHETLGVAGYWLIGLHATAALAHHYVLKDRLLERMSLRRVLWV